MDRLALIMQALSYYGLPADYQRVFTKNGTPTGLKPISITDAATLPVYAWVQLNAVDPSHPISKPANKDITCVRNISFDVDYPQDPAEAISIAIKLSEFISDLFAHPKIPVEDTGGGAHFVIPIPDLDTSIHGGGDVVNLAIRMVVDQLIKPEFVRLRDGRKISAGDIDFGSYDISRILSCPGTYRPPHPKKPDAKFLKKGYVRQWFNVFDDNELDRIVCQGLYDAILSAIDDAKSQFSTSGAQAQSSVGSSSVGAAASSHHDPTFIKWLQDWCGRNKNATNNRSDYFYRIVCAALRRANGLESLVLDHADIIDDLAGSKYGNRALFEIQRCLIRAKAMPRVRGGVLSIQDYIDALKSLGYGFRLNLCGGDIEVNGDRMTDAIDSRIMNGMYDIGFPNESRIRNVIRDVSEADSYHPVKEYLGQCYLNWDGTCRIDELVRHFPVDEDKLEFILSNNTFNFTSGHDIAVVWFKRWMIGAVAKVMDLAQNSVLVLEGPQDIGKSHFVRWLAHDLPTYHIEQAINLARAENDTNIRATRKWIWEIGEIGATTRVQDQDMLKAFLTRQYVTIRKPYGRNDLELPTLASYIGTVNDSGKGIYGDQTGNRRFATMPFRSIDHSYSDKFDVRQLWGEACAAYNSGEAWRLDKNESAVRDAINEIYSVGEPMTEIIPRYFHLNGTKSRMSSTEIGLYLVRYGVIREVDRQHMTAIGIACKKLGLRKINTGTVKQGGKGWLYEGIELKDPGERAMDHI